MIVIVDYQMGNLRSVQKAFEKVGFDAEISSDPHVIAAAEKLVLPGVGAFRDAINEIRRRDLVRPISDHIESQKPFLGICLGLQLLFDVSYEDGEFEGLGLIPGEVIKFELPKAFKVPHMGWNRVSISKPNTIFPSELNEEFFYFVHSYFVRPKDPSVIALEADYGKNFCAAIQHENLFASQFHPEKSQSVGLRLLKSFAQLNRAESVV